MDPQNNQTPNPENPINPNSTTPPIDTAADTPDPAPIDSTSDSITNDNPTPAQPTADGEPTPAGDIIKPARKSKTGLLIAVVIIVLALIGGGVAYMLWNNSDSKIITDAWHNLFKEKNHASINAKVEITPPNGESTSFSVSTNGAGKDTDGELNTEIQINTSGISFTAKAAIIVKNSDIYLKTDLGQLSSFIGDLAKYDNQWIKVSKDFIEQYSNIKLDDSQTCIANVTKNLASDIAKQDEILKVLSSSNVYKYQRANTNGDIITYSLDLDYNEADSETLLENIKNTAIFKDVSACPGLENFADLTDGITGRTIDYTANRPTVSFQINSATREFYGLRIETTNDQNNSIALNLTGTADKQDNVNISVPSGKIVDIAEVLSELKKSGLLNIFGDTTAQPDLEHNCGVDDYDLNCIDYDSDPAANYDDYYNEEAGINT
jgi:archaellum component FlaF (FlaF/FlaG flagellin family)